MPVVCNKCLFFVEKPYRRWYNPFVQFFSEMKGKFFNISTFSSKAQLSTFRGSLPPSARKCLIITVLFSPTKKGGICNPFYWMLVCYAHPQFFFIWDTSPLFLPLRPSPFYLGSSPAVLSSLLLPFWLSPQILPSFHWLAVRLFIMTLWPHMTHYS